MNRKDVEVHGSAIHANATYKSSRASNLYSQRQFLPVTSFLRYRWIPTKILVIFSLRLTLNYEPTKTISHSFGAEGARRMLQNPQDSLVGLGFRV